MHGLETAIGSTHQRPQGRRDAVATDMSQSISPIRSSRLALLGALVTLLPCISPVSSPIVCRRRDGGVCKPQQQRDVQMRLIALRGGSSSTAESSSSMHGEDSDLHMLDISEIEEVTEESDSREKFQPRATDPKCVGPLPPSWPGPYIENWGQADPNLPNIYNSHYDAPCIHMLDKVEQGDEAGFEALLASGADVNFRDAGRDGLTALHLAAVDGHDSIAKKLLEAGAAVDALDKGGGTPLMLAAGSGHLSTLMLLVRAGARVSHSNNMGNTALHKAAAQDEHQIIHALIGMGADPNARNCDGDTPLHHAVMAGSERAVRLLCQLGADMNQRNKEGTSAVREAKVGGQDEILEWFKPRTNDTTWNDPFPGPVYEEWNERVGNVSAKTHDRFRQQRQNNFASPAYWVRARKHGFGPQKYDFTDSSGELWEPQDVYAHIPERKEDVVDEDMEQGMSHLDALQDWDDASGLSDPGKVPRLQDKDFDPRFEASN